MPQLHCCGTVSTVEKRQRTRSPLLELFLKCNVNCHETMHYYRWHINAYSFVVEMITIFSFVSVWQHSHKVNNENGSLHISIRVSLGKVTVYCLGPWRMKLPIPIEWWPEEYIKAILYHSFRWRMLGTSITTDVDWKIFSPHQMQWKKIFERISKIPSPA